MQRFDCRRVVSCLAVLFLSWCAAIVPAEAGSIVEAAVAIGAHDLFVSPNGDDSNAGMIDSPLRTLQEAADRLESIRADGRITVWLRGGRYPVTETITLDAHGRNNVLFAAYPGETPVLDASRAITNFYETQLNGISVWAADVGALLAQRDFNAVYNSEGALTCARTPDEGSYFRARFAIYGDADRLTFKQSGEVANNNGFRAFFANDDMLIDLNNVYNPKDIIVRMLHLWKDESAYLAAFDSISGRIELSRQTSLTVWPGDRYWLENMREALSLPGEWYLDRLEGTLYYVPEEGQSIDGFTLWAGGIERILTIENSSRLTFRGISFTGTDSSIGETPDFPQAAYDTESAIFAAASTWLRFEQCAFERLGGTALKLYQGVTDSAVVDCRFRGVGANAIFAHGVNLAEDARRTERLDLSGNDISRYGRNNNNAVGILLVHVADSIISHNEIHDGYYSAISAGWVWGYQYSATRKLTISDNIIYDIGQGRLSDMGGIYLLGKQSGTVVERNIIHDVRSMADDAYGDGYGGWGLYLDEGASDITIRQNIVYSCGSQGLFINYGRDNTAVNNIIAYNEGGQVEVHTKESEPAIKLQSNLIIGDGATLFGATQSDMIVAERNLFWDPSGSLGALYETLQRYGFDKNSLVDDPLFLDAGNADFTLDEASPAHAIGFVPWTSELRLVE
ncbi:MAG: right-handed parallel beta-helix repeat-containing protein [Oscillospiraceae bacterium]|nr:right-handed parallel beta-helix repeat-containing protein [Oscillospiraceae bacterium]